MRQMESDLSALEPEQSSRALAQPVARKRLSHRAFIALILLRIYILLAVPLAIAAFVRALHAH